LNDNPITNEPGWEKYPLTDPKAGGYAEWVEYNLLKYTVHQYRDYLYKTSNFWNNFKDVFDSDAWKEKWTSIGSKIKGLETKGNKTYTGLPYGMGGRTDWARVSEDYRGVPPST
jgi:hypothetical protein